MKIKVNRDEILEGLQKVQSIVSPRTTLPILSNILVQADAGKLTLTATDLEVTVQTSIVADVVKGGGSTLPAKRVYSVFRELPNHDIEIEVDDKNVASITCGPSFFKLVGMNENDFPSLPTFEGGKTYVLEQSVLKEMLKKTSYAASTDETRYILNGVLLSFKDEKATVVATDGRRLALLEKEIEFPKEAEADYVVPTKTVNELIRTLGDEGELRIRATDNQVAFEFGDMLVISKLIEGTYPNYRQVIPSSAEERISIEREALLTAARRAALVTSEQSNSIKMTFEKNRLTLITITPDVGEAKETLPVKYSGKEISIAFNPAFLIEPLRALSGDEVHFEVTDDLSPGVLKSDIPFLYVLMPMRMA